jgi:hypothetical protein
VFQELFELIAGSCGDLRQEAWMIKLRLTPLVAVAVLSTTTFSFGQDNTPPANTVEQPATTTPHTSGTGTAPEGKGTTGWTGGARDQNSQTSGQGASQNPEDAKNQPWMATGEDLKGPPKQFPAGQTPE